MSEKDNQRELIELPSHNNNAVKTEMQTRTENPKRKSPKRKEKSWLNLRAGVPTAAVNWRKRAGMPIMVSQFVEISI